LKKNIHLSKKFVPTFSEIAVWDAAAGKLYI